MAENKSFIEKLGEKITGKENVKVEEVEKQEEILADDTNVLEEEKSAVTEDGKKLDEINPVTVELSDIEKNDVEEKVEDVIEEKTEKSLSEFIVKLENIINSNSDVDFEILIFKNTIRDLIAEFK